MTPAAPSFKNNLLSILIANLRLLFDSINIILILRKGCAKIYYICSHEKDYTEYNSQELRLLGHHRFPSDKREFRKVSDKPEDGGGGDGGSYPDGIYPFIHRAEPPKQTFQDDRTAAAFDR